MAQFYLAPDEEITSVIERLRSTEDSSVVLIIPKGASLLQSIVNVRLLKKKADDLHKVLGVVTNDSVSKHLAAQAGITLYQNIQDIPKGHAPSPASRFARLEDANKDNKEAPKREESINSAAGPIKVRHYNNDQSKPEEQETEILEGETAPLEEVDQPIMPPDDEPLVIDNEDGAEPEKKDSLPADYHPPIVEEAVPIEETEEPEDVIEGDTTPQVTPTRVTVASPKTHLHRPPRVVPGWLKFFISLMVILLLAGSAFAAVVYPKATVTVHVPSETIKKTVSVLVDPTAKEVKDNAVPGIPHDASVDSSLTAQATGKKQVGDKAKGVITISNSWSSDNQALPKNTGLVSADKGLIYRTLTDTTIPGATSSISNGQVVVNPGKVDVAVIADQPGEGYNLDPTKFTIQGFSGDKANKITGASSKAMSGGTTQELTVVAQSDIDGLKNDVTTKVNQDAISALKAAVVPTGEFLIEKSFKTTPTLKDPDHAVGDQADTINLSASSKAEGISVKNTDVEEVIKNIFKDAVPSNKVLNLSPIYLGNWEVASKDNGVYELKKEVEGQLVAKINQESVKSAIKAKRPSNAVEILKNDYGATSVDITSNIPKLPLLPVLTSHINVVIGE